MRHPVVVVGSEGFVGAHVRAALVARGLGVVGVGRPGSGAEVELDLADDALDVEAAVEAIGPTSGVVYLAATISRGSSVDARARENLRVIASSAIAWMIATHARWSDAAFVYTSSLKVEGHTDGSPIDPSRPIVRPDAWSYGSAKAFAERALAAIARERGATLAVVRPTYVYGPGQHAANAIPTFLRGLWAGEAPRIFGRGDELRDDVFAPDVAYVLAEACVRRAMGTFHAASGRAHTLLGLATACCQVIEELGGPPGLTPRLDPSRPARPWLDRTFDVTATQARLDYRPTALEEGLRRQARWIRDGADPATTAIAAGPIGQGGS